MEQKIQVMEALGREMCTVWVKKSSLLKTFCNIFT